MSPKTILVFCAQAILAQSVFSACGGCGGTVLRAGNGLAGYGLIGAHGANNGAACGNGAIFGNGAAYGNGAANGNGVASTGGSLSVSSASLGAPVGLSVLSENAYEGQLSAGGNLPFLGSVGIDAVLPSAGTGAVSYGLGNGAVGISSEGPVATGIISGETFAPSAGLINQAIGSNGLGIAGYGMGNAGYGLGNVGCGLGNTGYGLGNAGYGLGNAGYGLGNAGCGVGGINYGAGVTGRRCGC